MHIVRSDTIPGSTLGWICSVFRVEKAQEGQVSCTLASGPSVKRTTTTYTCCYFLILNTFREMPIMSVCDLCFSSFLFWATVLGWGTVKGCQSYISRHWWLMVGEGVNIQGVQQNTPHFCFCNFSASWWSRNRILGIFELPRFCRFENCPCFYS